MKTTVLGVLLAIILGVCTCVVTTPGYAQVVTLRYSNFFPGR